MGRPRVKADLYLADRASGMKYREIAEKYGVSYQSIAQVCAQAGVPGHTKPFNCEEVVYPELRKWMNENMVNRAELGRRLGQLPSPYTRKKVNDWLRGKVFPKKNEIDRLIEVTGLNYERLFSTEPMPDPAVALDACTIKLSKDETRFLMAGLIAYIWKMEDVGHVKPENEYQERKQLLEKMRKFERANFPEDEVNE